MCLWDPSLCSREKTEKKEQMCKLVAEDPVFSKKDRYFQNHSDSYKASLRGIRRIEERKRELKLNAEDSRLFKNFAVDNFPVRGDLAFLLGFRVDITPRFFCDIRAFSMTRCLSLISWARCLRSSRKSG